MPQHKRRNRFMLGLLAAGFLGRGGPDGQLGPGGQWGRTLFPGTRVGPETPGLFSVLCPNGLEQRGGAGQRDWPSVGAHTGFIPMGIGPN